MFITSIFSIRDKKYYSKGFLFLTYVLYTYIRNEHTCTEYSVDSVKQDILVRKMTGPYQLPRCYLIPLSLNSYC
jgi:hypothetical protein